MTFHDGAAHEERIGPNRAATRLVIVNGLPGAGKSTLAAALALKRPGSDGDSRYLIPISRLLSLGTA